MSLLQPQHFCLYAVYAFEPGLMPVGNLLCAAHGFSHHILQALYLVLHLAPRHVCLQVVLQQQK